MYSYINIIRRLLSKAVCKEPSTMAHYNFEGDLVDISERQLQFINGVIVELGFENNKICFGPVGKAGDNYAANVKRITIDGGHGSFQMIAKIAPTHEIIRQAMNAASMFKNEHIMYTELLPKFVQLQKDAEIAEKEQLRYAKCYGSLSEQPDEVILLEDLTTSDFVMLDRFSPLANDSVKSVLKNFAILHSLSFVLRHKDQDSYSYYKKNITDNWTAIAEMEHARIVFQALEEETLAVLEDQKHIRFLQDNVTNIANLIIKISKNDSTNKYTVIQQGDLTTNNIMFRFEGEKIIESVMIDYQNSKNTSPACDLLYMIFNCSDHETRRNKFYDWIDYYYSEVEKSLSKFNLKANLIYPRDRLDSDLKQYSNLLVGFCIFSASLLVRKTDDAAKVKDVMKSEDFMERTQEFMITSLDEETKMLFKNRVIGLIESCIELELS